MIFAETWQLIMAGKKTRTSRLNTSGLVVVNGTVLNCNGKAIYQVGHTYAVLPARGKKSVWFRDLGVRQTIYDHDAPDSLSRASDIALKHDGWKQARILVQAITSQDVRDITSEQAQAEGFASRADFWTVWCKLYHKGLVKHPKMNGYTFYNKRRGKWCDGDEIDVLLWLLGREDARYKAVVYDFSLVEG